MAADPDQLVNYRIGIAGAAFTVGAAVLVDITGFILMLTGIGEVVTEILGITFSVALFLWYFFHGVSYTEGKAVQKMSIMGACSLVEWIPFVNGIMPTFTIETVMMYRMIRKEDRERAQKKARTLNISTAKSTSATSVRVAQFQEMRREKQQAANDNQQELQGAA